MIYVAERRRLCERQLKIEKNQLHFMSFLSDMFQFDDDSLEITRSTAMAIC